MVNPKLIVEVAGDSRKLNKTLRETETATKRWANRLQGASQGRAGSGGGLGSTAALLKGGGIALGAGIAAREVSQLTDAASDLNEQITKSQAVFGRSSAAIEDWSTTTASSFGISQTAALEASGTFGNLFNTVGIVGVKAGDMSKALVQLAADLASFNNATPEDTLDAIRSGLIGEAEPLRRYGVLLSEARVQQRALADTGKTTATSLTAQEKALARYEIILNDTKKAQGDFSRTSGGLANQQRILKARLADTQAELGTHLLPVMIKATEAANKLFGVFDGNRVPTTDLWSQKVQKQLLSTFGPEFLRDALAKSVPAFNKAVEDFSDSLQPIELKIKPAADNGPISFGQPGFKTVKPQAVPTVITPAQRNTFFDAGLARDLDRVQDVGTIKGQISALTEIAAEIQKRIAATKDITRKLNLEDDLVQVNRQKKSLGDQLVSDAAEARRQQKALAEEAAAATAARKLREKQLAEQAAATRLQQRTSRQFRELGLDASGDTVTPGVANLKKRVANIAESIAGTKFDTPKLETQLARFRKVLSEGLVPKDVRSKIDAMLRDINDAIKGNTGAIAKTSHLNADKILEGLGLSPDESKNLKARLTQFNAKGDALSGGRQGTVGAFGVPIVVNTTVNLDGQKVATNTTRHQQRHQQANPTQKRGGGR